jgi:hypothetical protein
VNLPGRGKGRDTGRGSPRPDKSRSRRDIPVSQTSTPHHRDERQPWDRHPACLRCVTGWKPIPRQRPDPESNRDQDLRRVLCVPLHHRDDSCSEPTTGLAPVSSGLQDRRLAVRATSATSTSARSRTPCGSIGICLLSQEHARVWAPGPQAGSTVFDQVSSFTFQYASLRNFDQLSIRTG